MLSRKEIKRKTWVLSVAKIRTPFLFKSVPTLTSLPVTSPISWLPVTDSEKGHEDEIFKRQDILHFFLRRIQRLRISKIHKHEIGVGYGFSKNHFYFLWNGKQIIHRLTNLLTYHHKFCYIALESSKNDRPFSVWRNWYQILNSPNVVTSTCLGLGRENVHIFFQFKLWFCCECCLKMSNKKLFQGFYSSKNRWKYWK